MEKNWELVHSTSLAHRAEIIRALLEDNQIEVVLINKKDSSYNLFGEIEIYVNIAAKEKAIELIKQAESE